MIKHSYWLKEDLEHPIRVLCYAALKLVYDIGSGFELWTSGVRSNHSASCATSAATDLDLKMASTKIYFSELHIDTVHMQFCVSQKWKSLTIEMLFTFSYIIKTF